MERTRLDFCRDWLFRKTGESEWEEVALPHTWNARDGQDGGNDYWRGTAVYRKVFARPDAPAGARVVLECCGAAMTADVFLNGRALAHHEGGFSTFRVDLTDSLCDENVLKIAVDNGENDHVYPQKADFTFYGGLYRPVSLLILPERHFECIRDGSPGIRVTPRVCLADHSASVLVESWQNGSGMVELSAAGQTKAVFSADGHAQAEFRIENVHLWDGPSDPYLYTARARLTGEGGGDAVEARFGCRTMEIDPEKGFLLNGKSCPLRGVSRHQDYAGMGNAVSLAEHRRDLELIREIGANSVRLAHYQHAQEFYDLCDEAGLIVWAEIPYITRHMPAGRRNTLDQMRELITQCANHPCIACWGLSNEITAASPVDEDLLENHRLLGELCHRMDPDRMTVMAHAFMLETDSPLLEYADAAAYNLYFGWYLGELAENDAFFDAFHARFPNRPIALSEYGADANPAFQTASPCAGDYSEQYQCVYHEHLLQTIRERPYLWASYVWNLFDFAADGRDEGGAHGVNQKGLVTMDRRLKKDAFYLYKAAWNRKEPFVHLCGRRYMDRTEEITEVKVYSNCAEVSLLVDGRLLETQTGETVFRFRVPITGEHRIEARSGAARDVISVRRTARPNPSYVLAGSGGIVNWFDEEDFKSGFYSIRDTLGTLKANPDTASLVNALMERASASRGDVAKSAHANENLQRMMARMPLQSLLKQAGGAIPEKTVRELNAALQRIPRSVGVSGKGEE